jgi:hypothetical protein
MKVVHVVTDCSYSTSFLIIWSTYLLLSCYLTIIDFVKLLFVVLDILVCTKQLDSSSLVKIVTGAYGEEFRTTPAWGSC